jgi:malto-oligosyltrehalose synthase/4-alpha-glucanotransferase
VQVYNPVSTYRLQFSSDFTLEDAGRALSYLAKLGIKTIYASPLCQAVSGSKHGYDVTDPMKLSADVGSEASFQKLIRKVRNKRMGWMQDFVPNHMAYSVENPWIFDVLEKGKDSDCYHFFDICQDHPDKVLQDKLMLPFFGKPLDRLIHDHDLSVHFDDRGFSIRYFKDAYPVSVSACSLLLRGDPAKPASALPPAVRDLIEGDKPEEWKDKLKRLFRDFTQDPETRNHVNRCLTETNEDPDRIRSLVDGLCYLPVCWKETESRINYRRFFTINSLICTNIHENEVFKRYHELIKTWIDSGKVDGLRIDHIDGLYDPSGYLEKLRLLCGERIYLSVEKILEKDEELPPDWPVQGTTGYDFLGMVNNLLTNGKNGDLLLSYYREWKDETGDVSEIFHQKKRFILHRRLKGELDNLTHECLSINCMKQSGYDPADIRHAIAEFLVFCPVYKIYQAPSGFSKKDRAVIKSIMSRAVAENSGREAALKGLRALFLLKDQSGMKEQDRIDVFFRHCMQYTGPLMAKGIEDTAFYAYNPFIAHNEVGDSPAYAGIDKEAFHLYMENRQDTFPLTMNTLSTHDTKRGEDARARLNVLSDIPDRWISATRKWRVINHGLKRVVKGMEIPDSNDEYLIYQALCAHLPMDGQADQSFIGRMEDYLVKAIREAKEYSTWSDPDMEYEQGTREFLRNILSPENKFLESLGDFMKEVIPHALVNALVQIILKNTVPGVPDTYQGSETWNLNFVDPDNRRPVDYKKLSRDLNIIVRKHASDPLSLCQQLWRTHRDGKIKQWITYVTLKERHRHPDLFLRGGYIPLKVAGRYKDHIMAFYRTHDDQHLLIVLPLHTAAMPPGHGWEKTRLELPYLAPQKWENLLTGITLGQEDGTVGVSSIFEKIPFGVWKGIPFQPERRAGILLHVSSLPAEFGIGDFGAEAKAFIDFLQRSGQRYWQILPLGPSNRSSGYSPYSSLSAFAGNVMFLDPHDLVEMGLLEKKNLAKFSNSAGNRIDHPWAEKAKNYFVDKAWRAFRKAADSPLKKRYHAFRERERHWLDDYALFMALKKHFNDRPWNEWPRQYRDRDIPALGEFKGRHSADIDRIIFGQFLFTHQWGKIKTYANDRSIALFGDVPIYISYDSADVWSHPGLFKLNPDKSMESVAGVPPDYFNKKGQLWGMPLYNWQALEKEGYQWWLDRLRKNLEWYDLVRLDHFRGFSAYWEVPASAEVAVTGEWTAGPGERLFDAVRSAFPHMPFVAEDLGQIDQPVYDLRDRYGLPGMKILQFGFGDQMPFSKHIPNNYTYNSIVYTGTHDNNPVRGWYRKEADRAALHRLRKYTGKKVKEKNVHKEMIRLAYASVARLVIIPMQDWLGLDENSRMNFPATTGDNWMWKMKKGEISPKLESRIKKKVKLFGRY